MLMNGGVASASPVPAPPALLAPNPAPQQQQSHPNAYAHLTREQQTRIQEDLADRERQASALAAAGMVAENVNYTTPAVIGQVLQAPPPLVGMPVPAHSQQSAVEAPPVVMEGINWNELGGNVDDMDMDFAAMFDPEQEQAFMQDAASLQPQAPPKAKQYPDPMALAPAAPSPLSGIPMNEHGTPNPLNSAPV